MAVEVTERARAYWGIFEKVKGKQGWFFLLNLGGCNVKAACVRS